MSAREFTFALPDWLVRDTQDAAALHTDEERLRFTIELASRNLHHGTGGPFGAAIFASGTGELLSVGVNLVTSRRSSMLHAEVVAILLAQQRLRTHDLADAAGGATLYCSCEPCAMCMGAIPWAGIGRVVIAAPGDAAESVGFDEGAKPADWRSEYAARGISVHGPLLEDEARAVFEAFRAAGGEIY
ncbi:MAG: nucleoside deaminase [Planctomycetota bacterium]